MSRNRQRSDQDNNWRSHGEQQPVGGNQQPGAPGKL